MEILEELASRLKPVTWKRMPCAKYLTNRSLWAWVQLSLIQFNCNLYVICYRRPVFPREFSPSIAHSSEEAKVLFHNRYSQAIRLYLVENTGDLSPLGVLQSGGELEHLCHVGSSFMAEDNSTGRALRINEAHSYVADLQMSKGTNLAVIHFPSNFATPIHVHFFVGAFFRFWTQFLCSVCGWKISVHRFEPRYAR